MDVHHPREAAMNQPISRNINQVGGGRFRCFSAPVNYFDNSLNILRPIDELHAATATIDGKSKLARERSVVRSYFDADGITLKPDSRNDEYLKISLESVKFKNTSLAIPKQAPVTNKNLTDMGAFKTLSSRLGSRLLIPGSGSDGFQIQFRLNLKNLTMKEQSGEFFFYSVLDKKFRFRIAKPCLLGPDLKVIPPHPENPQELVSAELKEDGESFLYIKAPGPGFASAKLPEHYWIDANIVYSQTSDGWLAARSSVSWAAACAGGVYNGGNYQTSDYATGGEGSGSPYWYCRRCFFMFDTSGTGLSGAGEIASANVNFRVKQWHSPCGNAHLYQGGFTTCPLP